MLKSLRGNSVAFTTRNAAGTLEFSSNERLQVHKGETGKENNCYWLSAALLTEPFSISVKLLNVKWQII